MEQLDLQKRLSSASGQADQPQRNWWPPQELPEPVVPYTLAAIDGIRAGRLYTEMGWK
jgi:hypothetical protein